MFIKPVTVFLGELELGTAEGRLRRCRKRFCNSPSELELVE